jgi:hypothetical protein
VGRIKRLKADLADCHEDISMLRSELGWLERDFRKHCALMEKLKDRWNGANYEVQQIVAYLGLRWEPDSGQLVIDEPQSLGLRQEIAELRTRWSTTYYQLEQQGIVHSPAALAGADVKPAPNLHHVAELMLLIVDHLGLEYDEKSGQLVAVEDTGGEK